MHIATAVWMLAACGGEQSRQSTGPGADTDAAARMVSLFETLSSDLRAAGGDCDRITTVLATWTDEHRDDFPDLSHQARTSELAAGQRQDYRDRLDAALEVVVTSASSCADHPNAQAAFTRFDVLLDP